MRERHGMSGTPLHYVWLAMKDRCNNPRNRQWANYGGRGVRVCERWQNSFVHFMNDMEPRPEQTRPREWSLERIDNDGDYGPDNCKWATMREQAANTRRLPNAASKKTHCPKGHPYSGDNLYIWRRPRTGAPYRVCKTCQYVRQGKVLA